MKVYVLHDHPADETSTIYGVYYNRDDAVKEGKRLWGTDDDNWDIAYTVVETELRGMP